MSRSFFLTGKPGVGKTSAVLEIARSLKDTGYRIGGMISRDVRVGGARVGFELEDLMNGSKGWLAHIDLFKGPRIGRYFVNIKDLDNVGVRAINKAVFAPSIDLVIIDEIGPMELLSNNFIDAVLRAIKSKKIILGTIHQRAGHFLIDEIKSMKETSVMLITLENRDKIYQDLYQAITEPLARIQKEGDGKQSYCFKNGR